MTTHAGSDPELQAARRRTFAVISHPDAGKSTLTEALALHARAITSAGAVHGKGDRRGVVSDWMDMEKERGISITSAALQFDYDGTVINLVDTPGHADFSEDTFRVLSAVDSAVMLLDAAKGLEPQTLKLFEVCRQRGLPVITFINKWDRPGLDALALCDQLSERIGLQPMPVTWPVGIAGEFAGVRDCRDSTFVPFRRSAGGADEADREVLQATEAEAAHGDDWTTARDESELLAESGGAFELDSYLGGTATPVLFGSAVSNFGTRHLLDLLVGVAPAAGPRDDIDGHPRPLADPFSAFVFKVQTGMDPVHRDQVAFARVCSGVFQRGLIASHGTTGRPFSTKYAAQVFGQQRSTVETAYPGDVVALVNARALRVGDTLYEGRPPVRFPELPKFAPTQFAAVRPADLGRYKQFRKGVEQLDQEGVVQVFTSDARGPVPVFGAVGSLQFEVATHRLEHEFSSPVRLDHLPYSLAQLLVDPEQRTLIRPAGRCEVVQRSDGVDIALFNDEWTVRSIRREHPEIQLEPLMGSGQ